MYVTVPTEGASTSIVELCLCTVFGGMSSGVGEPPADVEHVWPS